MTKDEQSDVSRRFRFYGPQLDPSTTLCVDGVAPGLRGLSHWPGHQTPAALRHDLSTGCALAWARRLPAEREALVGSWTVVTNNHYDTDGALSAFAVLRPEQALARAEPMLRAAATGDFGTWQGAEALAVDLTVMAIPGHVDSPAAAQLAGLTEERDRWAVAYRWAIDHLGDVLDDPFRHQALWTAQHARVLEDVAAVEQDRGVSVVDHAEADLAVVTSERPLTRIGLNHAAGRHDRVLLVRPAESGWRYRFLYRVESWFDLVRPDRPRPRRDLAPLVSTLQARETALRSGGPLGAGECPPFAGECPPFAGEWWCSRLDLPVAALGFGDRSEAERPLFGDPDLEASPASRQQPDEVVATLLALLT